jgi:hypothetical protein
LVKKLISKNDDEVRGQIKEIEFFLGLPDRLHSEAKSLSEGELP